MQTSIQTHSQTGKVPPIHIHSAKNHIAHMANKMHDNASPILLNLNDLTMYEGHFSGLSVNPRKEKDYFIRD